MAFQPNPMMRKRRGSPKQAMTTRRGQFIRVIVLLVVAAGVGGSAVADPNPHYRAGDWRAFTTMRYVTSFAFAPDFFYFGTRGGVARYDRLNDRWVGALTTAEGLPVNAVRRLAYNPSTDELYAETARGYSVYNRMWDEWRDVPSFPDSLVKPWKPANLNGLQLPFGYDALEPGVITDPHLRSYKVIGAAEDFWGTLWVGTWGQFVWTRPSGSIALTPQTWGLFHDNVEAIYLDSGAIYFGGTNYNSADGALSIFDTLAAGWRYIEARYTTGFSSDHIRAFAGAPGERYLWMATDQGVVRLDRRSGQCRSYGRREGLDDDRIYALCLDGDILWVGTETGINGIYIPSDSVFIANTPLVNSTRVASIDVTDDIVWLGTDRGVFRLVKPVAEWRSFGAPNTPLGGRVRVIRHHDGQLYVGAERGIAVVDLKGLSRIAVYDRSQGLPDDNIFDLAVTDSILWAATRVGLVRFVPVTRERRVITVDDGLLDLLVQTIVVDGDYLWLGTERGANRFRWNNPQRID